jgi:hydrogenase maturation factor
VFEHPGLLGPDGDACTDDVCITCSDSCEVVEVSAVTPDERATVLARGRQEDVDVSLVGGVRPHDLLLVQAGVALDRIEEP